MIDRPSAGSCLIPACSELISSTARWGDSDGCPGDGDSAKPFPFAANQEEEVEEGRGRSGVGGGCPWETEVVTKSFTQSRGASGLVGLVGGTSCSPPARKTNPGIH